MAHPLLEYFGVSDMRDIRNTERFKKEIEPLFEGPVTLSYRETMLIVIGRWKREPDEQKNPGIYAFATEGIYKGRCVTATITF